jgi:hypothetical protein
MSKPIVQNKLVSVRVEGGRKETHNLIISDEVYLSAEVSEKILWMIS